MKKTVTLHRALVATRCALRKLIASLAAQIIAPAPLECSEISNLKSPAAPRSARRAAAASRRVPPPSLQTSTPSTVQLWNTANLRPEYPCVFFRSWIADEVYVAHMAVACHYATWNSRNPCPN